MFRLSESACAIFRTASIRLLYSAGHTAINNKVKTGLMFSEAQYEYLVFNDSDVEIFAEIDCALPDRKSVA